MGHQGHSALSLCAEVPGTRYHTWFYVCTEVSAEVLMHVQRAAPSLLVLNRFSLSVVPDHCLPSHTAWWNGFLSPDDRPPMELLSQKPIGFASCEGLYPILMVGLSRFCLTYLCGRTNLPSCARPVNCMVKGACGYFYLFCLPLRFLSLCEPLIFLSFGSETFFSFCFSHKFRHSVFLSSNVSFFGIIIFLELL